MLGEKNKEDSFAQKIKIRLTQTGLLMEGHIVAYPATPDRLWGLSSTIVPTLDFVVADSANPRRVVAPILLPIVLTVIAQRRGARLVNVIVIRNDVEPGTLT